MSSSLLSKNIKIKIYRTIYIYIYFFFNGCETFFVHIVGGKYGEGI